MKKTFKSYGELKYVNREQFNNLKWNPYNFQNGWERAEDGTLAEIYSCGNEAKTYNIPLFIAVQA